MATREVTMATHEENLKKINDELEKLTDEEIGNVAGGVAKDLSDEDSLSKQDDVLKQGFFIGSNPSAVTGK